MVAETKDNNFDYTQLHHLTNEEVSEYEGGIGLLAGLGIYMGGSYVIGAIAGFVDGKVNRR